jgi:tetratricopeptide (TPR) repeat protein
MKLFYYSKLLFSIIISFIVVINTFAQISNVQIKDSLASIRPEYRTDIPVQYDEVCPFNNGIAAVSIFNHWGLINNKGEIVIPMIFNKLTQDERKIMNSKGNLVIAKLTPNQHMYLGEIDYEDNNHNYISTYFHINGLGKIITPYPETGINKFDVFWFNKDLLKVAHDFAPSRQNKQDTIVEHNKYGLIKEDGEPVTQLIYDNINYTRFNDNIVVNKDGMEGLIDSTGKEIIELKYSSLDFQYNGKIIAKLNNKYGVIKKNEEIIIPFYYDKIEYNDKFSIVMKNGSYGVVDSIGNVIIPIQFEKIYQPDNITLIVESNGKYGVYDQSGKMIAPNIYDEVGGFFDRNICSVKQNDKWGMIDKLGNVVIPIVYNEFWMNMIDVEASNKKKIESIKKDRNDSTTVSQVESELIPALYDNKWGVIDPLGNVIIPFEYYSSPRFIANGIFVVEQTENHYGCVNKKGEIITPFIYENIFSPGSGYGVELYKNEYQYYGTKKNNKVGLITTSGKLIFPCIYESIIGADNNFKVKFNGKEGVIDKTGKEIIPIIYDEMQINTKLYVVRQNMKWGAIDKLGKVVIPIIYDEINYNDLNINDTEGYDFNNCFFAKKNGTRKLIGCFDKNGKVIIPVIYDNLDINDYNYHFLERIDKLYLVSLNGEKGCIDKNGKVVIPTKYSHIDFDFDKELIFVYIDKQEVFDKTNKTKRFIYHKFGCYDKNGNEILSPIYESKTKCLNALNEKQFKVVKNLTNNISIIRQNYKYGCANKVGEVVVPIIFDYISGLSEGMGQVKISDKWGYIIIKDSMKLNSKDEFYNNEICFDENDSKPRYDSTVVATSPDNSIVDSENSNIDSPKENDYKYINSYIKDFKKADNNISNGNYKRAKEDFEKLKSIDVFNHGLINGKIKAAEKYQKAFEMSSSKIDSIIIIGNNLLTNKKFDDAISVFKNAFEFDHFSQMIKERIEFSQELIIKAKIENLKKIAIKYFDKKDYFSARKSYEEILQLDRNDLFASSQIKKINDIVAFLEVRKTKSYDYKKNNPISFQKFTNYLDSVLSKVILKEDKGYINFKYDIHFDTLGVLKKDFKIIDKQIVSELSFLSPEKVEYFFEKPLIYGYYINSNFNLTCNLKWSNEIFKIKYNSKEKMKFQESYLHDKDIVEQFFNDNTYKNGNYSLSVKTVFVNDKTICYYCIFDFSPTDLKDLFSSKSYKSKFEQSPIILTKKGVQSKLFVE